MCVRIKEDVWAEMVCAIAIKEARNSSKYTDAPAKGKEANSVVFSQPTGVPLCDVAFIPGGDRLLASGSRFSRFIPARNQFSLLLLHTCARVTRAYHVRTNDNRWEHKRLGTQPGALCRVGQQTRRRSCGRDVGEPYLSMFDMRALP